MPKVSTADRVRKEYLRDGQLKVTTHIGTVTVPRGYRVAPSPDGNAHAGMRLDSHEASRLSLVRERSSLAAARSSPGGRGRPGATRRSWRRCA